MWRKQDESKVSATSLETAPSHPAAPPVKASSPGTTGARPAPGSPAHLTNGLVVKGEITGREDLLVDGEVHGQIRITGARVTIGPSGRLVAGIDAREIVIRGKLKGDLRAREHLQIAPSGCVIGDAVTPRLVIEEGAELRGNVDTTRASGGSADGQNGRAGSTAGADFPNAARPAESSPAGAQTAVQVKEAASGA